MKPLKLHKKIKQAISATGLMALTTTSLMAQLNVGSNIAADGSAMLQVSQSSGTAKYGFLPPQLVLTSTTTALPVAAPADGLIVYNTTAGGSGATAVSVGYYYWSKALVKWVSFNTSASLLTNGNIFSNDGTIAGSGATRTVTMNGNAINFTGGNIGLGQIPLSTLEIASTAKLPPITTDIVPIKLGASASAHNLLTRYGIQAKASATTAGTLLLNPYGGKVGIGGPNVPLTTLDVEGSLSFRGYLCPVNINSYTLVASDIANSVYVFENGYYTSNLTLPPSIGQVAGQVLYLLNGAQNPISISGTNTDSPSGATLAGSIQAGVHGMTYMWNGTVWVHML